MFTLHLLFIFEMLYVKPLTHCRTFFLFIFYTHWYYYYYYYGYYYSADEKKIADC